VYPFFKIVDKDNSGGIEYNEFEGYVLGKWNHSKQLLVLLFFSSL
jgi:hypothetical protein